MTEYTQKTLAETSYWERLHGDVKADSTIVVTLHGLTGTYQMLEFLFADIEYPVREVALQGSFPSGLEEYGGYAWFPNGMDFYDSSESEQAPHILKATERVAAFLKALKEAYSGQVVVTGFSQGGDLSFHLAAYYPQLVDLAIPAGGRLSEAMRPESSTASTRIRIHHGAADEIVSLESAQEALTWLKNEGFDVEIQDYAGIGHEYSTEMIANIQNDIRSL